MRVLGAEVVYIDGEDRRSELIVAIEGHISRCKHRHEDALNGGSNWYAIVKNALDDPRHREIIDRRIREMQKDLPMAVWSPEKELTYLALAEAGWPQGLDRLSVDQLEKLLLWLAQ